MPIEYLIDEERRVLEIVFLGAVTRNEIATIRDQIVRENRDALAYDSIVDLRQGSMSLTTDELREVARGARVNAWPSARCAFVAPHDPSFLDLKLFELPVERVTEYRPRVRAVTPAECLEVARRHFPLDGRGVIVAVGPAKDVAPQLERFGPVEVVPAKSVV